jgi:hypothetical protein
MSNDAFIFGFDPTVETSVMNDLFEIEPLLLISQDLAEAIMVDAATTSRDLAPLDVAVPAGAVVERAKLIVHASAPGWTTISSVAEVRGDVAGYLVIDFRRMRTVKGLRIAGATVSEAFSWTGAEFSYWSAEVKAVGDHFEFAEMQTERLRIKVDVNATQVAAGAANLPTAPADLELLVANKRVWFQAGEVKRSAQNATAQANDFFVIGVDATEAIATAAAAATPVKVELRSSTPGKLNLGYELEFQRVHPVVFPEGPERVVTFATEGTAILGLPLPAEAKSAPWKIVAVTMTAKAKLAPVRILPEVSATISDAAELVLDADHAIAIKVEKTQLGLFGMLSGIRTLLKVEPGGAEIGAALLADTSSGPGEPLPGAGLSPATVDGPHGAPEAAWVTLSAPRPIPVPPDAAIWVVLQVSRGTAIFPLLASGGGEIRRGMPGGPWREFSAAVPITPRGEVRLVGEAPEGAPIAALGIRLSTTAQVGTPTSDGVGVTIKPASVVAATAAGVMVGDVLQLALTARAPGSYRFSEARVLYRLPGDQA